MSELARIPKATKKSSSTMLARARPLGNAGIFLNTAFKGFKSGLLLSFFIGPATAACTVDCAPPGGWDTFVNNLATDLAPLLTLLGEQVTTQYLNESLSWIDSLLFAFAPLGIISAMVAAIRVAGRPVLWSLIGRAKESRGVVEAELMSSTSTDVCELWGGEGVSRVLGSPVLLQLVYAGSGDVERLDDGKRPGDKNSPTIQNFEGVYLFHEAIRLGLYRKKGDVGPPDAQQTTDMEDIDDFLVRQNPPNLSLNVSIKPLSVQVRIVFAGIGFFLQAGVLVYGAISQYRLQLDKNKLQVPAYGFPVLLAGTLSLAIGMFLCAQAVETSTKEEVWEPTEEGGSKSVIWLQQGGQTVGDQRFGSFARKTGVKLPENRVLTSQKVVKALGNGEKGRPFLVIIAISAAFFGFVAQFVGLRAMHPSVTIAQLGAVLIMTVLRCCTRLQREGRNDIDDPDEIEGYELDWLAKHLKDCQSWEINTGGETRPRSYDIQSPPLQFGESTTNPNETTGLTQTISERTGHVSIVPVEHSASVKEGIEMSERRVPAGNDDNVAAVMKTRARLARLSHDWKFVGRKKAEDLHSLIEKTMNEVFDNMTVDNDLKTSLEFTWAIPIEASFKGNSTSEMINLVFNRNINENQNIGAWTIGKSELEAVLCLWISSIVKTDRQRARDKIPRLRPLKVLAPASKLAGTHYSIWVPRGRKPKLEKRYNKESRYYGYTRAPSSDDGHTPEYLCVDVEADDSITLCSQEIYSLFICRLAEIVQDIGGNTTIHNKDATARAPGMPNDPKTKRFRLHNSNLENLAQTYTIHGLGTTEDAYFSIISAFGSAGKLPYPYETSLEVINDAKEAATDKKWEDCLEKDSWLYKNSESEYVPVGITNVMTRRLLKQTRILARNTRYIQQESEYLNTWRMVYSYCQLLRREESEERTLGLVTLCLTYAKANPNLDHEAISNLICDTIQSCGGEKMHGNQDFRTKVLEASGGGGFDDFRSTARFLWENTVIGWLKSEQEKCHLISRVLINALRDVGSVLFSDELQGYLSIQQHLLAAAGVTTDLGITIEESKDSQFPIDLLLIRKYRSPIQMAAEVGNMEILKALLGAGAAVDGKPALYYGGTALQAAAGAGHLDIVKTLMENGAKRDEAPGDYFGLTALQAAAGAGHLNVVRFLCGDLVEDTIEAEARAVELQRLDTEETKMPRKADVINDSHIVAHHAPGDIRYVRTAPAPFSGRTALQAAAEGGHAEVVKYLLSYGKIFKNEPNSEPEISSLQAAASGGNGAIIKMLLDAGADIDSISESRSEKTPLEAAVFSGQVGAIELLLESRFDREKALVRAVERGYNDVIRHLFSHKNLRPKVDGEYGKALLQKVVESRRLSTIRVLVENGFNIDPVNTNGRTELHNAVVKGDLALVEALLRAGVDINKGDEKGATPLILAAEIADDRMVRFLLKNGADIHKANNNGNGPLRLASISGKEGRIEIVETLLQNGVDIEAPGEFGRTALLGAAAVGNLAQAEALLKAGADINKADEDGSTVLALAAEFADDRMVRFLLKNGADIHKAKNTGHRPLHAASTSKKKGRVEIIETLLQNGVDIEAPGRFGRTALLGAAAVGNLAQAEALLRAGADINKADEKGATPLILAAQFADDRMVRFLLKNGADIHKAQNNGSRPLHLASISQKEGRVEIIETLLQNGADIEAPGQFGRTALLTAAEKGKLAQAEALLKAGADTNKTGKNGSTALALAADFADDRMVRFLLKNGADIHKAKNNGDRPLHRASASEKEGRVEIIETLLQNGADIEAPGFLGRTALLMAAVNGNWAQAEALLKAGADINKTDENGDTALSLSSYFGHPITLELLIKSSADIHKTDNAGNSALYNAIIGKGEDKAKILEILLRNGIDISLKNKKGKTALQLTEEKGLKELEKLIRQAIEDRKK